MGGFPALPFLFTVTIVLDRCMFANGKRVVSIPLRLNVSFLGVLDHNLLPLNLKPSQKNGN